MKIKHYIQRKPVTIKSYTSKGHKTVYLYETWLQRTARKAKHYLRVGLWSTAVIGFAMLTGAILVKQNMPAKVLGIENTVVVESKELPPVLKRIAMAESYNSHYCTKALVKKKACKKSEVGQVLLHVNDNKTVDVGKYALNNTYHGAEAAKMGLNIYDEKDNETYALYLFNKNGSADWDSSRRNWYGK